MSRPRIFASLAAATFLILLCGACSAEALTERAASFGLEQAIDGDQDIDLDFGGDGSGGFSITTEEGEFSLNFDEENGGISFNTDEGDGVINFDEDGIVFNTDEGDGVINFDEDGIVFNTDEGDGVINFDEDNGRITFETSEGDGEINFDENGSFTIDTDEGEVGIYNSTEAPDWWPSEIGLPTTLVAGGENFSVFDLGDSRMTTGVFTHSPSELYATRVAENLVASGWDISVSTAQNGSYFAQLVSATGGTAQITTDNAGLTTITLTQTG